MKSFQVAEKNRVFLKLLRIMKLTVALVMFFCLQASADGFSQQKISLKFKKTEIADILTSIEKQTNYRFLYNNDLADLKQKINFSIQDADLKQVLDQMFANTDLSYEFMQNNLVVIKSANGSSYEIKAVVTGKVVGENNAPLSGVSVQVKGSNRGTTTDSQGMFSINAEASDVLVFSYVGYDPQEVPVGTQSEINITLKLSVQSLTDVVVIGYGTASKRDLTGSIVKVDGKVVADKPNTNPIASLQGRVAGLSVVNNGTPGQAPDIRIRGTVSIGQVHPLYVVDGILNDNIDYLNPNDIESIEVLKDPSSLAIFGVKGATGVIAITTKKAKAGQTNINFNTAFGFKKLVDKIKLTNSEEFDLLYAEENANNGASTPNYSQLTANTDWIDAVTRTGLYNADNLSVSGSSEKNRFNLGLGYLYDEGIIRHEKLQKWILSFSEEYKITKSIKLGVNLNGSRQNNPYDATWVLDAARKVMPQVSAGTKSYNVQNPYGSDSMNIGLYSGLATAIQNSGVINPLVQLENEWDKTINIEYRTVGSVYADITFLHDFNFRSTFYGDISTVDKRQYTPLYYAYDPISGNPYLYNQTTQVSEDNNTWKKYQQDYILTYKNNFGNHNLTATAGFTTYYFGNFNRTGTAKPYTTGNALPIPNDPRFWYITSGFEDPTKTFANSSQNEYTLVSYLGRILYNYKGKYYLNASIRDDASSQIPTKNRHQQFWAAGAAWEISKENFMAGQKIFDFLKLKGSIGVLGNQTASYLDGTPINYPFYPRLNTGIVAVFGNNIYSAAQPSYQPNPDLKWETVFAKEIGIELNAFTNRLHFEANYFNRTTRDLMTYVSRAELGLPDELINGGKIRNTGEEFSATWNQDISKDFSLNIGGNITFLSNKVLSLSDELPTGVLIRGFQNNGSAESRTLPGYPIGSFYGYVVEGIYQSYADILKSPVASSIGSYRPGDFKFKDVNGDGQITSDDRTVIGNPTPDFTYGGSVTLNYKGLSLSIDFVGVYGNEIFRTWGSLESPFQRVNYSGDKIDRWHGEGTSNWVPIISQADRFNYNGSTYNIEDGSYFRLRNIQLGYNFSTKLLTKVHIKNLRVFANVQNLKTWKNNYGYTAEYGGDATAFGYDNAGGAIPVVGTAGLNVTF